MRFETRYDRWLVAVLVAVFLVTGVIMPLRSMSPGAKPVPLALTILPFVIVLVVLLAAWPQYYVLDKDRLFIRQGLRNISIPYLSVAQVESVTDARSAPVFSTHRTSVGTIEGKRYVIAVADEERFLSELATRCPQLERRAFGLGMPLSAPINI